MTNKIQINQKVIHNEETHETKKSSYEILNKNSLEKRTKECADQAMKNSSYTKEPDCHIDTDSDPSYMMINKNHLINMENLPCNGEHGPDEVCITESFPPPPECDSD
jgi:hypothetical protein